MRPPSLLPNNKLPTEYDYDRLETIMTEWQIYRLKIGNNTLAMMKGFAGEWCIDIIHHGTTIAQLRHDETVTLYSGGIYRPTVADRMTRAVAPLGYQVDLVADSYWLMLRHERASLAPVLVAKFRETIEVPPSLD